MVFEVFADEGRDIITFLTDNIDKDFLFTKEFENKIDSWYTKVGPILRKDKNENKYIVIYERII